PDKVIVYVGDQEHEVINQEALDAIMPKVFRIDPQRALPNSVPISFLIGRSSNPDADPGPTRSERWNLLSRVVENARVILPILSNPNAIAESAGGIFEGLSASGGLSQSEAEIHRNQLNLAFDLLITVGGIDVSAFEELQKALRTDDEGLANGIVASMNDQLESSLNLARWWSQDSRFRLAINVRDFDIAFTIRDRTGSEYSFAERSSGMKYFLSYLVQFLAHLNDRKGPEILLMDEPDAFLSNQGQQDLLRLLHEFTLPTDDAPGGQVLYVTHSPFLIDKNRADRIRVLDKGTGEEGVRVVRDVGRNHFEPLRTSLGGFVGETTFIGNCNLMLEGLADQIYLAGMSDLLRREGVASTESLDLNHITLVPAGSASQVPYMTYLARGRDADKPAVIVLLDGDEEGDRAVKTLNRGGPRNRQLIHPDYISQFKPDRIVGVTSDRDEGPLDIEDLVPVEIAVEATKTYLQEMGMEVPSQFLTEEAVSDSLSESTGIFDAIQGALAEAESELRIDKLGFARHVMAACHESNAEPSTRMRARFAALFSHLTKIQRKAERERERESIAARVDRETNLFLRDQLPRASKAEVVVFLERIEDLIDQSREGDNVLLGIRRIRADFELDRDLSNPITDRSNLEEMIKALKYAEVLASQPEEQTIRTSRDV
ncbi:MAG: AAA family ATPase, partial [Chloroflexi bacterium]|nr:AAA family ATPase [Chloroflexota bacterium]